VSLKICDRTWCAYVFFTYITEFVFYLLLKIIQNNLFMMHLRILYINALLLTALWYSTNAFCKIEASGDLLDYLQDINITK
jgi:hypothetical protein